jgi:cupin fold WbuC family metalloprotein
MLTFDDYGQVMERCEFSPSGPAVAVEVPGGGWHTVASLEVGTVLFELKPGPYIPLEDKDFASWAPAEGEPECGRFLTWFQSATAGDKPPTRG